MLHFIILILNVHKIKLNLHSKIANFNYKVQNCKWQMHQNKICDVLSLSWNRTRVEWFCHLDICWTRPAEWEAVEGYITRVCRNPTGHLPKINR